MAGDKKGGDLTVHIDGDVITDSIEKALKKARDLDTTVDELNGKDVSIDVTVGDGKGASAVEKEMAKITKAIDKQKGVIQKKLDGLLDFNKYNKRQTVSLKNIQISDEKAFEKKVNNSINNAVKKGLEPDSSASTKFKKDMENRFKYYEELQKVQERSEKLSSRTGDKNSKITRAEAEKSLDLLKKQHQLRQKIAEIESKNSKYLAKSSMLNGNKALDENFDDTYAKNREKLLSRMQNQYSKDFDYLENRSKECSRALQRNMVEGLDFTETADSITQFDKQYKELEASSKEFLKSIEESSKKSTSTIKKESEEVEKLVKSKKKLNEETKKIEKASTKDTTKTKTSNIDSKVQTDTVKNLTKQKEQLEKEIANLQKKIATEQKKVEAVSLANKNYDNSIKELESVNSKGGFGYYQKVALKNAKEGNNNQSLEKAREAMREIVSLNKQADTLSKSKTGNEEQDLQIEEKLLQLAEKRARLADKASAYFGTYKANGGKETLAKTSNAYDDKILKTYSKNINSIQDKNDDVEFSKKELMAATRKYAGAEQNVLNMTEELQNKQMKLLDTNVALENASKTSAKEAAKARHESAKAQNEETESLAKNTKELEKNNSAKSKTTTTNKTATGKKELKTDADWAAYILGDDSYEYIEGETKAVQEETQAVEKLTEAKKKAKAESKDSSSKNSAKESAEATEKEVQATEKLTASKKKANAESKKASADNKEEASSATKVAEAKSKASESSKKNAESSKKSADATAKEAKDASKLASEKDRATKSSKKNAENISQETKATEKLASARDKANKEEKESKSTSSNQNIDSIIKEREEVEKLIKSLNELNKARQNANKTTSKLGSNVGTVAKSKLSGQEIVRNPNAYSTPTIKGAKVNNTGMSVEYYAEEAGYIQKRNQALKEGQAQIDAYNAKVKEYRSSQEQMYSDLWKTLDTQNAQKAKKEATNQKLVGQNKNLFTTLAGANNKTDAYYTKLGELFMNDTLSAKELNNELNNLASTASKYDKITNKGFIISNNVTAGNARNAMESYLGSLREASVVSKTFHENTNSMSAQLKTSDNMLKNVTLSYDEVSNAVRMATNSEKEYVGIGQQFKNSLVGKIGDLAKYTLTFTSFYSVLSQLKQGVSYVKEMDDALTELKKVTDETSETYANFGKEASNIASQVGSTGSDIVNLTADFSRLGYNLEDAKKLASNAAIYQNVSEDMNTETASSYLITAMKAFNVEAEKSISIVDKYNEVSNKYALSSNDIGEIMERASSALAAGGNTIDDAIAMGTAMQEITQNAETTGSTLKILGLRLRSNDVELKAAGEDTDGMAESVSKLRDKILALTNVDGKGGVDILTADGRAYKSTREIVQEIGAVYDKMDDIDQANGLLVCIEICTKNIFNCLVMGKALHHNVG